MKQETETSNTGEKKRMKKSEKWQHDLADMMKRNNLNYWSPTGRRDGEDKGRRGRRGERDREKLREEMNENLQLALFGFWI